MLFVFTASVFSENNTPVNVVFTGENSVIYGKFSIPSEESPYLVIKVQPSLNNFYIPDSLKPVEIMHEGPGYDFLFKKLMLDNGVTFFECKILRDSIVLAGKKYSAATLYTCARDVKTAISFIRSKKEFAEKKIILAGGSEGGMSAAIAASEDQRVSGLILIATPGVKGSIFGDYQNKCEDSLKCGMYGIPEYFTAIYSTITFQDRFEHDINGMNRFRDSCAFPLRKILEKNLASKMNYERNAQEVMRFIRKRWERENPERTDIPELRSIVNDYDYYVRMFGAIEYIQPQQIGLYSWNPGLYFPKIKCPVMAVYGTKDRQLEYKSSLENIRSFLIEGGNENFTELIFPGRSHFLKYPRNRPPLEEKDLEPVVNWMSQL